MESLADKADRVQRDEISINIIECLQVPQKGEWHEWHLKKVKTKCAREFSFIYIISSTTIVIIDFSRCFVHFIV